MYDKFPSSKQQIGGQRKRVVCCVDAVSEMRGLHTDTTYVELADLYDDQGHIVREETVPPPRHAIEERLPHFWQGKIFRIKD